MPEHAPYDLIAERWSRDRDALRFRERPYVDRFVALASPGGHILDLGCGSGKPIARHLLDRGYRVTGIDASIEMLRLARTNCPEAELVHQDIVALALSGPYDGIVAWDSIFHFPKAQYRTLFESFHRWLVPDAPLLPYIGGSEGEFIGRMFGVNFFYSGHAPEMSVQLLQDAGFEVLLAEVDDPSSRGHVAVLCRRDSSPATSAAPFPPSAGRTA
jgi:cyclopropane fatty-acyl-phospholipid synthase-like methyltransferase